MITGAGWLSIGPGFRRRLFDEQTAIDASAQASWRGYLRADASLVRTMLDDRMAAGVEALWQDSTQVNYFGVGADSAVERRAQYRLQTFNIVGHTRYRLEEWLAISGRVGWLDGPSVGSATGPFNRDYPDAQVMFADDPAMNLVEHPRFVHGEVSVMVDTRDHRGHPTDGAVYRAAAGFYADRTLQAFSFRRYELEGAQFIDVWNGAWIVALHGWGAFSDTAADQAVPFYLLPSLGGANTLRGYPNYRFHDRHLLLASVESRWPLSEHIDAAIFLDSGDVAASATHLGLHKTNYGAGVRVHTQAATLARFDVGHGDEGWQFLFRLSEPYRLSRLAQWTAAVPFVP
jgi:hypothetical protein